MDPTFVTLIGVGLLALAALAYGLIMAGLWIVRRDLLTPIVAHAVTNLALYIYVFKTQSWGLW